MKKNLLTFCFLIICFFCNGQKNPNKDKEFSNVTSTNQILKQSAKYWVEIFNNENYRGGSTLFTTNSTKPQLPEKLSKISLKLSPNTVAYLTINCTDIPYEVMFTGNTSSFTITDLGGICGIRIDERAAICIKFNGIETQVHNNDCKKISGNLSVSVIERQSDGSFVQCYNKSNQLRTTFLNTKKGTLPNYSTFVFNDQAEPPSAIVRDYSFNPWKLLQDSFIVGKSALKERKVFVRVHSKLNSEHKQSDLALDYTDNVSTKDNNTEFNINRLQFFNIQSNGKVLIAGPYTAQGIQARAGYIITKNLRILLSVVYPFELTGE
jgi:hypothetical protein